MEVFTLVKAGIRNRKGIMFGFMILTMLIVISVISILGVSKNYESALEKAFEVQDCGTLFAAFKEGKFSAELEDKLKKNEMVDHFQAIDSLVGINATVGENTDGNGYFIIKQMKTVPIFNEAGDELIMPDSKEYSSLSLKKGEVYLPYGLIDKIKAKVGEKIKLDFLTCKKEFTIKGFVQESFMGSSIIGYKLVFMSDEDFDEIYSDCKAKMVCPEDEWATGKVVYVYPSDKADSSSNIFLRKLNIETKFDDMATSTLSKEMSEHYTGMFINVTRAVVTGFAVLLFVIFLIVAGHNISTEMELDYTNLGILKSQGFTDKSIRLVYILEYLIVEFFGIVLGVIASIPCERWLSRIFFSLTAILPDKNLPIFESAVFSVILFVVTFVYIYLFSRKVTKTSPVKAISNNRDDFYFESRLSLPIKKRCMGLWLGLRQITSAPKRYVSVIVVTSLLVFTIITTEQMANYIQSRNALTAMGEPFMDLEFAFNVTEPKCKVADIEKIVEKYTEIEGRWYISHLYTSINGESVMTVINGYPDDFASVYKGRNIKYDNEIIITDQIKELLNIDIGDTVTIGRDKFSEEYVVVGIFQTMNDTGKAISMTLDGISRLKEDPEEKYTIDQLGMYGVVLKDTSFSDKIVKEVKELGGDDVEIEAKDFEEEVGDFMNSFYIAAEGSKILIYVLSFAFALVTVIMVCAKAFIFERKDIGISCATGFRVKNIRSQFAFRFMIVSIISSVFGILLSIAFSEKTLESVFSMFGIGNINFEFSLVPLLKPALLFALFYLLFGYIASGKVRKVSSRELITE